MDGHHSATWRRMSIGIRCWGSVFIGFTRLVQIKRWIIVCLGAFKPGSCSIRLVARWRLSSRQCEALQTDESTAYQKVMMAVFIKRTISIRYCNKLLIDPLIPSPGPQGLTPPRNTTAVQCSGCVCVHVCVWKQQVLFSVVIASPVKSWQSHGGDLTVKQTYRLVWRQDGGFRRVQDRCVNWMKCTILLHLGLVCPTQY